MHLNECIKNIILFGTVKCSNGVLETALKFLSVEIILFEIKLCASGSSCWARR